MSNTNRAVFHIAWRIKGSDKWGREVVISDPIDDAWQIPLLPCCNRSGRSWDTEADARTAAVAALRDLADRIERGEP